MVYTRLAAQSKVNSSEKNFKAQWRMMSMACLDYELAENFVKFTTTNLKHMLL